MEQLRAELAEVKHQHAALGSEHAALRREHNDRLEALEAASGVATAQPGRAAPPWAWQQRRQWWRRHHGSRGSPLLLWLSATCHRC